MARKPRLVSKRSRRVVKTRRSFDSPTRLAEDTDLRRLRHKLRKARHAYFNTDSPIMSDEDYDQLEERLRRMSPNDKLFNSIGYAPDRNARKVALPYPMPSLDKVKPNASLERWLDRHSGPYEISDKGDGVSALLVQNRYGKLQLFTRGNGVTGSDITHLIPFIRPRVTKLPSGIKAIRGELAIGRDTFAKKYAKQFANARNLTSGVVNSLSSSPAASDLLFFVHGIVEPDRQLSGSATQLRRHGFLVMPHVRKSDVDEAFLLEYLAKRREQSKIDIDGLVIATRSGIVAFKAGYESATATVDKVVWKESRYGYLKPTIILKRAVKLSGASVKRVTGHNAQMIYHNKIAPGAVIEVTRSGDVIPKFMRTLRPSAKDPLPPGFGTKYNWNDTGVDLVSIKKGDSGTVQELLTFVLRMDVDKVKETSIEKLVVYGIDSIPKLLEADVDDMLDAGLGHAMAVHLHDRLRKNFKQAELPALMAGSNEFPRGFGERRLSAILEEVPFRQQLELYRHNKNDLQQRLSVIPGIGSNTARAYLQAFPKFVRFLKQVDWKPTRTAPKKLPVSGLGVAPIAVFTGFRDKNLEKLIKAVGGKIGGAVTKNTTHVVTLNVRGNSTKLKKAERYGVKILTPQHVQKLLKRRR